MLLFKELMKTMTNMTLLIGGAACLIISSCSQTDVRGTGSVERLERQPKPTPDNDYANQEAGRNAVYYSNDRRGGYGGFGNSGFRNSGFGRY